MLSDLPFTLSALRDAYAAGTRPEAVIAEVFARLDAANDPGIFLHADREAALAAARALGAPDGRPLWGIPFAVKDNIDVAGMPTTAACPEFAYAPEADAFVVARLRAAGAIVIGKTNLDQFATGLVGTRTPHPVPLNALDPAIVPGGSSGGSGVVVARGIVAFSLGTDTAGSGRVPAALNGIVGLKPTLGALSASGMVPACRTLDTISVFALTVADAWAVHSVAAAPDPEDAYSRAFPAQPLSPVPPRLTIAVPDAASLQTFGDRVQEAAFRATLTELRTRGVEIREIDFTPFYDVAAMLYEGAWVAERTAAVGARLTEAPETLHPVTRSIVEQGLALTAVDAFRGIYRLAELRRHCTAAMAGIDLLCVPTIPCFVTREQDAADPILHNSRLGTYTNFVNLLDMCGLAVPCGTREDGRPASVTLLGRAGQDGLLAGVAGLVEAGPLGATGWHRPAAPVPAPEPVPGEVAVAVCGAHMSGLGLNHQIAERAGRFLRACRTAPEYRFFALPDGVRPGLVRVGPETGAAIAVEVWAMPMEAFGSFVAGIPGPLGIGRVTLEDGSAVPGFLCEEIATRGAEDITALGDWRSHLARKAGAGRKGAA
ncbi:allophanate hydrolase [Paroceanicella profunda]|uniref:Allophanate hydrolase n=1 Tax=Paroceanicella profunda TaxID=2579971 RepID=A0A5B8FYS6_9RHOB|nr:allophanate hydrolase [Paroceanicella profunda]QDL91343.1 allophanate hydrolase [Paroceanicella profunda]